MKKILVLGGGRIGRIVFHILKEKKYEVKILDKMPLVEYNKDFTAIDIFDEQKVDNFIRFFTPDAIVNCLPFYASKKPAEYAVKHRTHYFDVTEDVETGRFIRELARSTDKALVPHCGLAPGIVSIIGANLIKDFDSINDVRVKCGVLPIYSTNSLRYAITWSVDGLVNQYCNKCLVVDNYHIKEVEALGDTENFIFDGIEYESFNTSGGIGTLAESFAEKVCQMSYQTIRYPGHRNLVYFLMNELGGANHREFLVNLFQSALPVTRDDVTIINITVNGSMNGQVIEKSYTKKFYSQQISSIQATSLEATTAGSLCAVISEVLTNPEKYKGFIKQENFDLNVIRKHTTVNF